MLQWLLHMAKVMRFQIIYMMKKPGTITMLYQVMTMIFAHLTWYLKGKKV